MILTRNPCFVLCLTSRKFLPTVLEIHFARILMSNPNCFGSASPTDTQPPLPQSIYTTHGFDDHSLHSWRSRFLPPFNATMFYAFRFFALDCLKTFVTMVTSHQLQFGDLLNNTVDPVASWHRFRPKCCAYYCLDLAWCIHSV